MLVINPMTNDTRVDKEAASLASDGHDVTVIAVAADGVPQREPRDGFTIVRLPYRRIAKQAVVAPLNRARARRDQATRSLEAVGNAGMRARLTNWGHAGSMAAGHAVRAAGGMGLRIARTRQLELDYWHSIASRVLDIVPRPDIVHAHDLGTLAAAARIAARTPSPRRPRVVYDSHELYVEQQTKWLPRERRMWAVHERHWIPRADAVITVSPGIAAELQRRYRLAETPTLVLNTPPRETVSSPAALPAGMAPDLRAELDVGDVPLAVYVGTVKPGRGVDRLLPAMQHEPWHLALVGAGTSDHVAQVVREANSMGIRDRLHVVPPVPAPLLPSWIASADVGVHPMEPTCMNHELALPNKLFDYVFAGLPVAVSDLPEMAAMVLGNDLGTVFDPADPATVAQQVGVAASMDHGRASDDLLAELSWERQTTRLQRLYRGLE